MEYSCKSLEEVAGGGGSLGFPAQLSLSFPPFLSFVCFFVFFRSWRSVSVSTTTPSSSRCERPTGTAWRPSSSSRSRSCRRSASSWKTRARPCWVRASTLRLLKMAAIVELVEYFTYCILPFKKINKNHERKSLPTLVQFRAPATQTEGSKRREGDSTDE